MDHAPESDTPLTSADAGRLLGVTPARVRQLAVTGRLPHIRTANGIRLFQRADVERLARERAVRREAQQ